MAALRILRAIEGEAISGKVGLIVAHTSLDVSQYVLNHNRDWLKRIEDDNGVTVEILADPEKSGDAYDLEKSGAPRERTQETAVVRADQTDAIEIPDTDDAELTASSDAAEKQEEREDGGRKRRRRRRRRKDTAPREPSEAAQTEYAEDGDNAQPQAESAEAAASEEDDGEKPKRRRRRGRRGGRRNRKSEGDTEKNRQRTGIQY